MTPAEAGLPANCLPPPRCPECRDGKCRNCDGTAWDDYHDEPTECTCRHD